MKNFKKLRKVFVVTFSLLLLTLNSTAQNIGIDATGAEPDASALLDLNATDKGFLVTRAEPANIASPAFGLMTLAPSDSCLYMYSGKAWIGLGGAGEICSSNVGLPFSFKCGSQLTDTRDSKVYETVKIGDQCWMSENMNFETSDSWCFNNDETKCDTYGRLYNWNSTMDGASTSSANPSGVQGICPLGWHVPSDAEWQELEVSIGMSPAAASQSGWRETNEANALKTSSWGGNNSSGFTALPGGNRGGNGLFFSEGSNGLWWTTTENSAGNPFNRFITGNQSTINRDIAGKVSGYSVRCVLD